ncbi:hypothetical protein [Actinoplanes sp. NPDC051851]|uniref:hypothetical protein n=1 Tax=Actinoplanes sp. NPDC051851 TaxID=3154753 RepID=UPI00341BDBAA
MPLRMSTLLLKVRPLADPRGAAGSYGIGIPRSVVVGRRLAEGIGELRDRRTGERHEVALVDIAGVITPSQG